MSNINQTNSEAQQFRREDKSSSETEKIKLSRKEEHEIDSQIEKNMEFRRNAITEECMKSKKWLDLSSSKIDDLDAVIVSLYLAEQHTKLEMVHLGTNLFTDEGLIDILSGLQWHIGLKELYLGNNNNLTELGLEALIETIPIFEKLEILGLANVGMTDEQAIALSCSIKELENLKTLSLNTNNIGDETLISFSILLTARNLPCTTLHLGENKFTSKGLVPFFKSLQTDDVVKQLYLNDIPFDTESVNALNKMLIKNQYLEQLNLGNCNINDEAIVLIKEGLILNTNLNYLHLWGNKITDEAAEIIRDIIEDHNNTLFGVTLFDNQIKDADLLKDISDFVKQNGTLSKIPIIPKQEEVDEEDEEDEEDDGVEEEEEQEQKQEQKERQNEKEEIRTDKKEAIVEKEVPSRVQNKENMPLDVKREFKEDHKVNKTKVENKYEEFDEDKDEEQLEELEKEISLAEREFEDEQEQIYEQKKREKEKTRHVTEKVWQGFKADKKNGLLRSTFQDK